MKITTFRGERSLHDLVEAIFSDPTVEQRSKAERALLKANPQLARLDRVAVGTPVLVPAIRGLRTKSRRDLEEPVGDASDVVARSVRDYGRHLEKRNQLLHEQLKEQGELLKDRRLRRALGNHPEGERLRKQIIESIPARADEAEARLERLEAAIKEANKFFRKL